MAYEALVLLGMLALLTFICRLWPILLLIILGIFAAVIRLLFLSSRKIEVIVPLPLLPEPVKETTEKDVQVLAYSVILRRVTELVLSEYPEARWVWERRMQKNLFRKVRRFLFYSNRAGGYRRAKVVIRNLQVVGIEYNPQVEENAVLEPEDNAPEPEEEPEVQNYELLAFEWQMLIFLS